MMYLLLTRHESWPSGEWRLNERVFQTREAAKGHASLWSASGVSILIVALATEGAEIVE